MSLRDTPGSWPVVDSTNLHRDDWVVALRRDRIHPPGEPDTTFSRIVVEHPGAAMVLAVDGDPDSPEGERVCLIRQYRHAGGATFVEVPAGICDVAGEDPVETARRELAEEVALQADHWEHLLTTYPSVGISAEVHHYYVARGLRPVDRPDDFVAEHEEARIEIVWVLLAELVDAVLDGRVREAPVALAVLAYEARRRRRA
ncbi:NUDIX domain-containing protein [Nocardioides sp. SYSU DS0651]|uniref:NUDIX domain-containing protein n=1 Tax=Nocardioides sp. SYSU DS0651 TaxID=3415955 RepID=UPI003F4C2E28